MPSVTLKWFRGVQTVEEAHTLYRRLARDYHPDKSPQHAVTMQEINAEYDRVKTYFEMVPHLQQRKQKPPATPRMRPPAATPPVQPVQVVIVNQHFQQRQPNPFFRELAESFLNKGIRVAGRAIRDLLKDDEPTQSED